MDGSVQVLRPFCKCNICKEPFNDIKSLETHILDVHRFKQLNGAPVTKTLKREVKADPELQKDEENEQIIFGEAVSLKIEPKLEISATRVVDSQSQIIITLPNESTKSKHSCDVCRKEFVQKEHKCRKLNKLPMKINLLKRKKSHRQENQTQIHQSFDKELQTVDDTSGIIVEFGQKNDDLQNSNFKHQSLLDDGSVEGLKKTTVTKHRCDVCKKEFVHKSYLEIHIKVEHENIKEFKCDHCPKSFGAEEYLRRHKSRVHSNKKIKFECDICHMNLNGSQTLKEHKKQVHDGIKEHVCEICTKAFAIHRNLRVHIKVVHHKIKDHVCDICKRSFSVACNLKVHKENVHKGAKDIKCDKCDAEFKSEFALRLHVKRSHVKLISQECEFCCKTFQRKLNLLKHIREIHESTTEYNCLVCERSFKSVEGRKEHTKIVHENQLRCNICKCIIPNKEEMKLHQKSHKNGKSRFDCHFCGKSYAFRTGLEKHILEKHKLHESIKDKSHI